MKTKQAIPVIDGLVSIESCASSLHRVEPTVNRLLQGLAPIESCAPPLRFREARARFERVYFANLLQMTGGNVSKAAYLSGLTRQNFYAHIKRLATVTKS